MNQFLCFLYINFLSNRRRYSQQTGIFEKDVSSHFELLFCAQPEMVLDVYDLIVLV